MLSNRTVFTYKYEFLLFALTLVIFDKIFFTHNEFYTLYIWPLNMLILVVASFFIFREVNVFLNVIKNILFLFVILVPIISKFLFASELINHASLIVYLAFYALIFKEVIRQVWSEKTVSGSVILGSLCGYLLIIIIASFSFVLLELMIPTAFNGLSGTSINEKYNQLIYFSLITISSIGYGDITPAIENSRLLSSFWGVVGQFYMVAVVGIIVSKFTNRSD